MGSSDDLSKLAPLVAELDQGVSKNGAVIRLVEPQRAPDKSKIVGNRLGYLRLGVELLKAGLAPEPADKAGEPFKIDVDLRYVIDPDSDVIFREFELRTDLTAANVYEETVASKVAVVGCLIFCVALVVLAVVALVSLFR